MGFHQDPTATHSVVLFRNRNGSLTRAVVVNTDHERRGDLGGLIHELDHMSRDALTNVRSPEDLYKEEKLAHHAGQYLPRVNSALRRTGQALLGASKFATPGLATMGGLAAHNVLRLLGVYRDLTMPMMQKTFEEARRRKEQQRQAEFDPLTEELP